tara:strand:- start:730 stop:996 length:267 start_codon:yes stop_codon:yes gene_type:complete
MWDPIMIVSCVLIGTLSKSYSKVVIYSVVFAIALEIIIYFIFQGSYRFFMSMGIPVIIFRVTGLIIGSSIFFGIKTLFLKYKGGANES